MAITLNDLTVDPGSLDRDTLLEDWAWLLPHGALPVLITALGDAFVQTPDGAVHYLDTCAGDLESVAENGDEFQTLLRDKDFVVTHFFPGRVMDLREAGVTLAPGQCYSYKHLLVLGGVDETDNIEACDIAVHFSTNGQIHGQVQDLPEGAEIKFEIEDDSDAPDDEAE